MCKELGVTDRPKLLCISDSQECKALPPAVHETYDVCFVSNPIRALAMAAKESFAGIFVTSDHLTEAMKVGRLLQNDRILEGMADGVALLDGDNNIMWANERLRRWANRGNIVGEGFYNALGSPEIVGPDYCPFHTAVVSGQPSSSTLRTFDNRYLQAHAAPIAIDRQSASRYLIVTIRDVTVEMQQQQKLAAIHKAGSELSHMTSDEIRGMNVADRIELLKCNIIHYTKDLLHYDVVEVRLLEPDGRLRSLLAVGLDPEAANRDLWAKPQGNGVTGFVASSGKSYLCEDTAEDPLFLEGFKGSKSSLTVPILLHDTVIGTFNVESPNPKAFTESDLQFLEIFSRNIALALNTLQLLAVEKAATVHESVEQIHREVALPVDEILNDAVHVLENYAGESPELVSRIKRLLRNARDIKQVIHQVGQRMSPAEAVPAPQCLEGRKLRDKRVLVVDEDATVRSHAHNLLERYGCSVETAHNGAEAIAMVKIGLREVPYDIIISEITLSDMNGHDLQMKLKELMDPLPLVLMKGYGYDREHVVVKARENGLHPKALLGKPFKVDLLVQALEAVLDATATVETATGHSSTMPIT